MIAAVAATFTLRRALGRALFDRSGAPWGTLSDFSLRSPDERYLDLVLDDGAPCVVPDPKSLALAGRILLANLADADRIRGERDPDDLRLAADLYGKHVVAIEHARIGRVRDVRLTLTLGQASIDSVLLGPPGIVAFKGWAWVDWREVIALDAVRAGRGLPHHRRRLAQLTSDQRESVFSVLAPADVALVRGLLEEDGG